ncbi:MAG: hypothetical protein BGO98_07795 [Myxococcales bacterium 68-20]|nr:MAG: hypothetical protein BGO98_07795 [Myxococcales bacterium 68-20]
MAIGRAPGFCLRAFAYSDGAKASGSPSAQRAACGNDDLLEVMDLADETDATIVHGCCSRVSRAGSNRRPVLSTGGAHHAQERRSSR